jgi:hypothetical protein
VNRETPDTPSTEALTRYAPDFDGRMLPAEDGRWVLWEAAVAASDDPYQKTGDEEYDSLREYWDGLSYKQQWEAFFEAVRQRDLAIAHDRQPYPTAEAYETLAAAHAKCQKSIDVLRLALAEAYADLPDEHALVRQLGGVIPGIHDGRDTHGADSRDSSGE